MFFFIGFTCWAQVSSENNELDERMKGIIYRKEILGEFKLHNNGLAFGINFGEIRTFYRTNYYHLEFGSMHSPREYRQTKSLNIIDNKIPESFKFGKQNSVFILRGSKGFKYYLTEKARRKGISLGYDIAFGPSLAILKPYYLIFMEQELFNGELIQRLVEKKYTEESRSDFLDYNKIYGGSSFQRGIKEISFLPGIQSKFGLFFSVGSFDQYAKAAEVGIMVDAYIKRLPIMIETENLKNSHVLINFFLKVQFGKRKN